MTDKELFDIRWLLRYFFYLDYGDDYAELYFYFAKKPNIRMKAEYVLKLGWKELNS